jgi:hypothetical protein
MMALFVAHPFLENKMTSGSSNIVDISADLKHETDGAYLIDSGDGEPVWVPKSQVEYDEMGTFSMPEWLARDKGLI